MTRPPHVRCRLCGAILPGWLPVAKRPHATLLMSHLDLSHHEAFVPLLMRMATEDLGTVAMEAFERVEQAFPKNRTHYATCSIISRFHWESLVAASML